MKNLVDLLTNFRESAPPEQARITGACPGCSELLGGESGTELRPEIEEWRVCPTCRYHFPIPARERIARLVDPGSFDETNRRIISSDPLSFSDKVPYRERLTEARRRTGLTEAVVTGTARINGLPLVLAVMDFEFLGGSMGSVVGEKIALAFELAVRRRLPVVTIANSGGARMQEGMLALAQMAKTAAAARRLHLAGLPHISVLANPTTGGVFASFANLGDIILAEPRALIGFAGPRVVEELTGQPLPPGSHRAEFLLEHGMIDRVVDRTHQRDLLAVLLDLLTRRRRLTPSRGAVPGPFPDGTPRTPWHVVTLARHELRPTGYDYVYRMIAPFVELHGDRAYGDDPAIVGGIGDLSGQAIVVIAQERGHGETAPQRRFGRARAEGYRKALRLMRLAAQFKFPLVTLIDTPGADPGVESEVRGLAHTLAECLAELSDLPTPTVAAVVGEGASGGALALGVADRVLMQEHAIYSVIAPEGAAAILYHTAAKADDVTRALRITARDCLELGVIDAIVPEPAGGAHTDQEQAAWRLHQALVRELEALAGESPARLVKKRYEKYRRMGEYGSYFREALGREMDDLSQRVARGLGTLRGLLPHREEAVGPETG